MIGQWLAILALALVSFAIAAFYLRMPRQSFAMFGAVLLLGLVGYTWAGSTGQVGSPKQPQTQAEAEVGEAMVEARMALFDPNSARPDYLTFADGYARKGRFDEASEALRSGLRENPDHLEGWLALGMALTGHAEGFVTPAANYAYEKARELDPANPGPDFFLGNSLQQSGQIVAARDIWGRLLENSPDDAPWKAEIEARVARLDQMIANAPMLQ